MPASPAQVAAKEKLWRKVEKMWREGRTMSFIAKKLDWTTNQLGVQMAYMRAAGWDLPHRRKPRTGATQGRTPRKHGRPRGR